MFEDACRQLKMLGKGHVKHYKEIKRDTTPQIATESNKIVSLLHDSEMIDTRTYQWAKTNPSDVQTQYFYTIPKIHKDAEKPPGRPIVSCLHGPTTNLSKLIDSWLIDIVPSLPTFARTKRVKPLRRSCLQSNRW